MGTRELELYRLWCDFEIEDAALVRDLWEIENDENAIYEHFYRDLDFGTAGLRGIMGAGTNRMNIYTVRRATQGLANWLLTGCEHPSIAIAYDSRNNSALFAKEAARVLAASGVKVHIFCELMPTPTLSYAVRKLCCDAGIVITASHNPAAYNGYKVYGSDGCQIGPSEAAAVYCNIEKVDTLSGASLCNYDEAIAGGRIELIPNNFEERFVRRVLRESINPSLHSRAGLRIVYTPLNGAGNKPVRDMFKLAGITDVTVVPEQELPDGDFPTCPFPNPEIKEALALGLTLAKKNNADLLVATDPDCDRLGVAVNQGGNFQILSGNQVGALLLDYISKARIDNETMPAHPVAVKSMVSTKLADAVAAEYGVEMRNVLTGFRYIGGIIAELDASGGKNFILGFEESCGYLSGGYVRDKDAVNACLLVCEMASYYKLLGKTLVDALESLYQQFGYFLDTQSNFYCEGAAGLEKIRVMMSLLREEPPAEFAGERVLSVVDYLPEGNALEYRLENGASVIIRPSGTEPKVKAYYSVKADTAEASAAFEALLRADVTKKLGF